MKIKEIIEKWEKRADEISISDTDDPYYAKEEIRDLIKDIKECGDIDINDDIEEER